jgi:hypothetical protein
MRISLLLLIAMLALIAPFVIGPILVYLIQRIPLRKEFYSLTGDEIASCTDSDCAVRSRAVEALGFTPMENLQSISPGSKIFTTVFYNFSTLEAANVTEISAFRNESEIGATRVHYFEFSSSFDNDLEVNTNNSTQSTVFYPLPERQNHSLPTIQDPAVLYAIHRNFTSGIAAPPRPLPAGPVEREVQMEWGRVLRRQAEVGYFKYDESDQTFRPTAKGAILMSWKLIWPVGAIRRMQARHESERLARTVMGR